MSYAANPIQVEAFRLPGEHEDVPDTFEPWCERVGFVDFASGHYGSLEYKTAAGRWDLAGPGEWIVKGPAGFYHMNDAAFRATFRDTP